MTTRRNFLKLTLGTTAMTVLATTARAAGHATHMVEIKGGKFSPATLDMQVGDKVTFVNLDGASHTATADNGSFDTGRLNKGDESTVTIAHAGTHSYICKIHPAMKGQIVAS